ncbi:MAG: sigma 54-dependent Fis family transcriptional regulator [Candidatus Wallbacteria bacterium]|nr:sigma 54-dependent Fis family transcriptional regulator [Candidatus Wallbacteria bacterium]
MAESEDGSWTRRVRLGESWATLIELPGFRVSVLAGADCGRRFDLPAATLRLGSGPENDVVLTDRTVSRHHARLVREGADWLIVDQQSSNGTFVDGVRIRESYVRSGSQVRLGETVLEIQQRTESRYAVAQEESALGPLIGASAAMRALYGLIRAVAPTAAPVLIEGESGTGKELAARALHELSGRAGPLVVFDAAATSQELIRSELFGHARGAFTGAAEAREGAFRRANLGTLFIDEFGELPLALQPNLLRALESREVTPVGSDKPVPLDVRVVVATNRDLRRSVDEGRFREDLYHRVAVVRLRLPPLRERREDIPLLVRHFATKLAPDCRIEGAALQELVRNDWPGNVRALRNSVERLGIVCRGRPARPEDLELARGDSTASPARTLAQAGTLEEAERRMMLAALERTRGNKAAAARELGISLSTLKRRLASFKPGAS